MPAYEKDAKTGNIYLKTIPQIQAKGEEADREEERLKAVQELLAS